MTENSLKLIKCFSFYDMRMALELIGLEKCVQDISLRLKNIFIKILWIIIDKITINKQLCKENIEKDFKT